MWQNQQIHNNDHELLSADKGPKVAEVIAFGYVVVEDLVSCKDKDFEVRDDNEEDIGHQSTVA